MNDWLVIIFAGCYIALEALLAYLGHRFLSLKGEGVRKFIHIATSFLIFPLVYVISNPYLRLLGPSLFIVVNAAATYSGMGKIIGMYDEKRHLGLVVYPFSVLVLVLLFNLGVISGESAVIGTLSMGVGDGMAALVGTKWGRHKYKVKNVGTKSLEGTAAMAAATFIVALIFSSSPVWAAIAVASAATLSENFSPSGIDNISVPLISAFLMEALCRL
ncbi:MAG: diacylglycerol/polyprenol kinase family protein [Candidatus Ornithospirochaeta sp.]